MSETKSTDEQLASLVTDSEAYFAGLYARVDGDDKRDSEEADEEARQAGYGLSIERHVIITLAGGGPSMHLDVTLDEDGDVSDVVAVSSWWSAPIRTEIYEGSALYRFAEQETSWIGRGAE